MSSKVWFISASSNSSATSLPNKLKRLLERTGFKEKLAPGDLMGIKVHFGEEGNITYLRPELARLVADYLKDAGAKPFLTDTSTLYRGQRSQAVDHFNLAIRHGFSYATVGCPIIFGDGLIGRDYVEIELNQHNLKTMRLASAYFHMDGAVVLSHVKGHIQTGMGAALKNVSMGMASRGQKQGLHSDITPQVNKDKCTGCGECAKWCPEDAITLVNHKAEIDGAKCIGCGECVSVCRFDAISVNWQTETRRMLERMAEFCLGYHKLKGEKTLYINVMLDITPDCDCAGWSDLPVVPNVGIVASYDPVAVDQASADLVNQQQGLEGTRLKENLAPGQDKFAAITGSPWYYLLEYAEQLGLGQRDYDLEKLG